MARPSWDAIAWFTKRLPFYAGRRSVNLRRPGKMKCDVVPIGILSVNA